MRLNCVESFYAFLLRFHNKGSEEVGRPPTAKPRPRPPTRGRLAAIRASPKGRLVPLTGAAVRRCGAYGHSRGRRGGRHLAGWLPGADGARGVRASF
ncbi:hypothetical protein GW17_00060271 [Ensete ventricosum]|nr:hypothetical protein GW17_00060271 [Ensete ventricosum]